MLVLSLHSIINDISSYQRGTKLNRKKYALMSAIVTIIIAVWGCQILAKPTYVSGASNYSASEVNIEKIIKSQITKIRAKGLDQYVLKLALTAYHNAKKVGHGTKDILTVVDYSLASAEPRMWVIDMNSYRVLYHTHVSHGIGSGDDYARRFSNRPGSGMSSLGLMETGNIYSGKYGASLNLYGLDGKFNSNAYSRRIVIHSAHYVDEKMARRWGRIGRSLGCLALSKRVASEIMQTLKGGSLIFCYYPDKQWLRESNLLKAS
jgi:hypothetical protein